MRINKNLYPPEGYYFIDTDGARIFGDSWPGVITRTRQYRERQGRPVGDVDAEVTTQACARAPSICHEVGAIEKKARVIASLKSRVLRWFRELEPERAFVTVETWKQRATICAECPHNQPLPGGCSTCRAAVAELRKSVLDRRPNDGRLNACSILGEDLPTAAHMERPAVANPGLPDRCWRKKLI